jgi:hypothetical protein
MRGDLDCDGSEEMSLIDLTTMIDHLFLKLEPLCCEMEADVDGHPGCSLGDLSKIIDHMYMSFEPLPACP